MKLEKRSTLMMAVVVLLAACSKDPGPPAALSSQETSKALGTAFEKADSKTKAEVTRVLAEVEKKDDVQAFVQLQELAARPDLQPEQRAALSGALMGASQRLQKAAEAGNLQAQEMLKLHRASK